MSQSPDIHIAKERPSWFDGVTSYIHGGNPTLRSGALQPLRDEGVLSFDEKQVGRETYLEIKGRGDHHISFIKNTPPHGDPIYYDDFVIDHERIDGGDGISGNGRSHIEEEGLRKSIQDFGINPNVLLERGKKPVEEPIEYAGCILSPKRDEETGIVSVDFDDIVHRLKEAGVTLKTKEVSAGGIFRRTKTRMPVEGKDLVNELPDKIVNYDGKIVRLPVGSIEDLPVEVLLYWPKLTKLTKKLGSHDISRATEQTVNAEGKLELVYAVTKPKSGNILEVKEKDHPQFSVVIAVRSPDAKSTLMKNPDLDCGKFETLFRAQETILSKFQ